MSEERALASGRGKWSRPAVPHKGWQCVDCYDVYERGGTPETCEMCETQRIRYVHLMRHPDYPETLRCGCVCAGHMADEPARARNREAGVRTRAARRARFPDRAGWKISPRGTPHIRVEGCHLMVVRRRGGFAVGATPPWASEPVWGRKTYPTERAARLAAFDALEYFKRRGVEDVNVPATENREGRPQPTTR